MPPKRSESVVCGEKSHSQIWDSDAGESVVVLMGGLVAFRVEEQGLLSLLGDGAIIEIVDNELKYTRTRSWCK